MGEREAFVGIDAAKLRNAIAIAEGGRSGEIRYLGEVDASETNMARVIRQIAAKYDAVHFCYEAGPTGYGLHRLITALGQSCTVVAPSLIPRKPGDRIKTNRRGCDELGQAVASRRAHAGLGARCRSRGDARSGPRPCRCDRDITSAPTAGQRLHAEARPALSW